MTVIPSDSLTCAICLNELGHDESMLKKLHTDKTISHIFHKACVDKWLESRKTCPTCREEIPQKDRPVITPAVVPLISLFDLYGSGSYFVSHEQSANFATHQRLESIYRHLENQNFILRVVTTNQHT